jgi:phosphoserine aminotransferase
MNDEAQEKEFMQYAKEARMYGVKGHRSVGGFRMSLYNALPLSSVQYGVEVIQEFAKRKG